MKTLRCVAVDLGAGSCRISLAEWNGAAARVHLVHRYPNGPVERNGHLFWNLERLCQGTLEGLRLSADLAPAGALIQSVGVDGWAIDYVRIDAAGRPLGDPFCYRDPRTDHAMPEVWELIPRERIYELTGIQFLRFNTLYQLYADRRDGLDPGAGWVNVPEYMLHHLCGLAPGTAVSEYTNSTHTQLLGARTREWCDEIFAEAGLDRASAPRTVPPGTRLDGLRGDAAALPCYRSTQVIAPACHDTGAAVAGIPDAGRDWAFISSGTWSLVGTLLDAPCTSAEALRENFTNEGGIGGTIRFLKNVNGLWLLEECLREWDAAAPGRWNLPDLIAACAARPAPEAVFNVDAEELILPGDMPAKINRALERAGHPPVSSDPAQAPALARLIFASLAARYAQVLRALQQVTGRTFSRLYVMGGGSQNDYLNRLIAERSGLPVTRGPVESSTLGNLAIQFAALESAGGKVEPAQVARWAGRLADSL
jgi:rhamnulokinase